RSERGFQCAGRQCRSTPLFRHGPSVVWLTPPASHRRAGRTSAPSMGAMAVRERHLRLLTETIEAVNSTLDLEEVLSLVARRVAGALAADACFVYLYDDRAGELVLRATHGTSV